MDPKSRNAAIGGMLVVTGLWVGGFYLPGLFAAAPVGLEATLTLGIVALISALTPDPND